MERIDSTSVRVSWNLKNRNVGVHYFSVTYYPLKDKSDRRIKNTTESAITIDGLQPDVEYQFVVSGWPQSFFPMDVVTEESGRVVSESHRLDD